MRIAFDIFVLPFSIGLIFLMTVVMYRIISYIKRLSVADKRLLISSFFSIKIIASLREIVNESLLHKKIFKTNPLLGYMHTSLAFGWLLLIILGNIEAKAFSENPMNPPYYPIFFRFFEPTPGTFFFSEGFTFVMDFLLIFTLSGVVLAYLKRFKSSYFGMQRTTNLQLGDKLALTALWFIFPIRLLAESFTSGQFHTGGFMTHSLGEMFASFLPVATLAYPAWWAYSFALGLFFVALPFSRYMHIPTEPFLIFFRNAGIQSTKNLSVYSELEMQACSRCGICIDSCQLNVVGIHKVQASYFIRDLRYHKLNSDTAENCMICGRCNVACPVGINITNMRCGARNQFTKDLSHSFQYIPTPNIQKADVLYFAGCMSHLTPSITIAMEKVLQASGDNYLFVDKEQSVCCGRPLELSGQFEAAQELKNKNKRIFETSGAKILVTSCPICFKTFKDDYQLDNIEIMHHSQYIMRLIEDQKISVKHQNMTVAYHDPCELGRNAEVYLEPRVVINQLANLSQSSFQYEKSLCCGGSIANTKLSSEQKDSIAKDTIHQMGAEQTDALVTSCPLCKKTFGKVANVKVLDIAQLTAQSLVTLPKAEPMITARKSIETVKVMN